MRLRRDRRRRRAGCRRTPSRDRARFRRARPSRCNSMFFAISCTTLPTLRNSTICDADADQAISAAEEAVLADALVEVDSRRTAVSNCSGASSIQTLSSFCQSVKKPVRFLRVLDRRRRTASQRCCGCAAAAAAAAAAPPALRRLAVRGARCCGAGVAAAAVAPSRGLRWPRRQPRRRSAADGGLRRRDVRRVAQREERRWRSAATNAMRTVMQASGMRPVRRIGSDLGGVQLATQFAAQRMRQCAR